MIFPVALPILAPTSYSFFPTLLDIIPNSTLHQPVLLSPLKFNFALVTLPSSFWSSCTLTVHPELSFAFPWYILYKKPLTMVDAPHSSAHKLLQVFPSNFHPWPIRIPSKLYAKIHPILTQDPINMYVYTHTHNTITYTVIASTIKRQWAGQCWCYRRDSFTVLVWDLVIPIRLLCNLYLWCGRHHSTSKPDIATHVISLQYHYPLCTMIPTVNMETYWLYKGHIL